MVAVALWLHWADGTVPGLVAWAGLMLSYLVVLDIILRQIATHQAERILIFCMRGWSAVYHLLWLVVLPLIMLRNVLWSANYVAVMKINRGMKWPKRKFVWCVPWFSYGPD